MRFDLHTHHERCGHAYGRMEDYIGQALELGLDAVGISDHCPSFDDLQDHPTPRLKMAKSAFPEYVQEALRLKAKYEGRIEVLIGVESDIIAGRIEAYAKEYDRYPFDYIIGSVHGIGDVSIFAKNHWNRLDKEALAAAVAGCFGLIEEAARSRKFQILGHFDALKVRLPQLTARYPGLVEQTLRTMGEHQLVMEVNTSGDKKGLAEWFPSIEILELAHHYKVQVTFGSDAHRPEHLMGDWNMVCRTLREIGYRNWAFFRKKKRIMVPIPE